MTSVRDFIRIITPEWQDVVRQRLKILDLIGQGPIGRRALSQDLDVSESHLRKELKLLEGQGLVETTPRGMVLTGLGRQMLEEAQATAITEENLQRKEEALQELLQLQRVTIVPGSIKNEEVLEEMAATAIQWLDQKLGKGRQVIAVMGGTSVAEVAEVMDESFAEDRSLIFVPGRGGFGDGMATQANTICAKLAQATQQEYYSLYTPDQVTEQTYAYLVEEPAVSQALDLLHQADALIFGIGEAFEMARRRKLAEATCQLLKDQGAVGEILGEFYDAEGQKVYEFPKIGLGLDDIEDIACPVAIAGGEEKAEAIKACLRQVPDHVHLVIDQEAAEEILSKENK